MALVTIPAAAAAVNELNLTQVSDQRVRRDAENGLFRTHLVGARLMIDSGDVPAIADHYSRIDAARATAARLKAERAARRALRAGG